MGRLREFAGAIGLAVLRLFDSSTYRCVWCKRISRGPAARIYPGWTCSSDCYDHQRDFLLSQYAGRS